jgi:hypothetical protein
MTEAKKDLLKNIALTAIGLLPIFIFANTENWVLKIIQIVGILCSGLNIILMFFNLQHFIDDLFPTRTFDDKAKTRLDKTIIFIVNVLFFAGGISMIFEIEKIGNTIKGLTLFWICGAIGVISSFLLAIFIGRFSKTIYEDSTRRYTILLVLPIGFLMLFPATLNFINRQFSNTTVFEKIVKVNRKSTDSRGGAKYFFCSISDDEERFEVGKAIYENTEEGENIKLCLQKGLFGFDVVKEFKIDD